MQDIADEVGLLKGSLYYYIDSKEDLLFGITQTIHRLAAANAAQVTDLVGGPGEKLRLLVELHVASFGINLQMIRVFYTEYGALGPERLRAVIDERRRYETTMLGLIEGGQRTGEFCPDLDARVANNAVLTMVNTIYMWFDERRDDLPSIAEQYATMVLHSLRCPSEHAHPPEISAADLRHPARRSPPG